jgi:hypothetical protein
MCLTQMYTRCLAFICRRLALWTTLRICEISTEASRHWQRGEDPLTSYTSCGRLPTFERSDAVSSPLGGKRLGCETLTWHEVCNGQPSISSQDPGALLLPSMSPCAPWLSTPDSQRIASSKVLPFPLLCAPLPLDSHFSHRQHEYCCCHVGICAPRRRSQVS